MLLPIVFLINLILFAIVLYFFLSAKQAENAEQINFYGFTLIVCSVLGFGPVCCLFSVDKTEETFKVLDKHRFENGDTTFYIEDRIVRKQDASWCINFDKIEDITVTRFINSYGCYLPMKEYSVTKEKQ